MSNILMPRPAGVAWLLLGAAALLPVLGVGAQAAGNASARRTGVTLYVSRKGDNTSGLSWRSAFHSIQAALNAIPDDRGGHRIIIRPDTYTEANLFPAHKGARGAYNVLLADTDGTLGSGAKGWVVIDSGDPKKGFKSVDWWSAFRADPTFSSLCWDRWKLRGIYATGSDAGLFWDITAEHAAPFSIVVEDSVGIGRAFGGGAAEFTARPDEPVTFRRCKLWCLDWWGDASGAYVRAENTSMPSTPDAVFEDCTLVGPDNALKSGNPGYASFTHVALKRCRLMSLNFSQPRGTPSRGVIYDVIDGRLLHVDLEDCTLAGYKVFGAGKGTVSYTTKGKVQAYVQFEQEVPKGMTLLNHWPFEMFNSLCPSSLPPNPAKAAK